jgi:hypothetical protein
MSNFYSAGGIAGAHEAMARAVDSATLSMIRFLMAMQKNRQSQAEFRIKCPSFRDFAKALLILVKTNKWNLFDRQGRLCAMH